MNMNQFDKKVRLIDQILIGASFFQTHPADATLPVGGGVPWPVVLRHTAEVVDAETSVTFHNISWKVTLKAVPVMTFRLPILKYTE